MKLHFKIQHDGHINGRKKDVTASLSPPSTSLNEAKLR